MDTSGDMVEQSWMSGDLCSPQEHTGHWTVLGLRKHHDLSGRTALVRARILPDPRAKLLLPGHATWTLWKSRISS